jgi:hypothetical protein
MTSAHGASKSKKESIAWTIGRRLAMVIVLALAFLLSAIATIFILFRGGETRVPDVKGMTEVEAVRVLKDAGLNAVVRQRPHESVPANTVIETEPRPNASRKKGFTVTVFVSSGPPPAKVQARAPGRNERGRDGPDSVFINDFLVENHDRDRSLDFIG